MGNPLSKDCKFRLSQHSKHTISLLVLLGSVLMLQPPCFATSSMASIATSIDVVNPGPSDELVIDYQAMANWMWQQDASRQRAAALTLLSSSLVKKHVTAGSALPEEIRAAVNGNADGATLFWLAMACNHAKITPRCIEAGLDDAIIAHDQANLFSRQLLYPDADPALENQLLLEAFSANSYIIDAVLLWFDALANAPSQQRRLDANEQLAGAFMIALAASSTAFAIVANCRDTFGSDSRLAQACDRIIDAMDSSHSDLISERLALELRQSRAEAVGNTALARTLAQEHKLMNDWLTCQGKSIDPMLMESQVNALEYVELLSNYGEYQAIQRFAMQHGIDCARPQDP